MLGGSWPWADHVNHLRINCRTGLKRPGGASGPLYFLQHLRMEDQGFAL
jgi:hypothetical protein